MNINEEIKQELEKERPDFMKIIAMCRTQIAFYESNTEFVLGSACMVTGISLEQLKSKDRTKPIPLTRQMIVKHLYDNGTGWSNIGRIINKNHDVCMAGYKRINNILETKDKESTTFWNKFKSIVEPCQAKHLTG